MSRRKNQISSVEDSSNSQTPTEIKGISMKFIKRNIGRIIKKNENKII